MMSKKTLIILAALLGIFLAFLSFESGLSEHWWPRTSDVTMILLARVAIIITITGGLLFLLGKRAGENVSFGVVLRSVKEKIILLYPYILVFIGVALVSFLILSIVYQKNQAKFTRLFPSPDTGENVTIPSGEEGLKKLDIFLGK